MGKYVAFAAAVACPGASESFCIPLPSEQLRLQAGPFRLWTAQLAVAGTRRGAIHSNRCCGRKPATLALGTSFLCACPSKHAGQARYAQHTSNHAGKRQDFLGAPPCRALATPPPTHAACTSPCILGRFACACAAALAFLCIDSAEALPPSVMACRTIGHDCGPWLGLGPIFFWCGTARLAWQKKCTGPHKLVFRKVRVTKMIEDTNSHAFKQRTQWT